METNFYKKFKSWTTSVPVLHMVNAMLFMFITYILTGNILISFLVPVVLLGFIKEGILDMVWSNSNWKFAVKDFFHYLFGSLIGLAIIGLSLII